MGTVSCVLGAPTISCYTPGASLWIVLMTAVGPDKILSSNSEIWELTQVSEQKRNLKPRELAGRGGSGSRRIWAWSAMEAALGDFSGMSFCLSFFFF